MQRQIILRQHTKVLYSVQLIGAAGIHGKGELERLESSSLSY